MKSPTSTILHSIQALKSKLRNDHLELQGIRRDFAMGPTKPILQREERSQSPAVGNFRLNSSIEKNARAKLIEIRKNHQAEVKSILERHKLEKQQLIHDYQNKIEEITNMFEGKINEQASYIHFLEEQTQQTELECVGLPQLAKQSPNIKLCPRVFEVICAEMTFDNKINFQLFAAPQETDLCRTLVEQYNNQTSTKYEKIVNDLLHENATLLESVETLKMENRRLLHHSTLRENSDQGRKSTTQKNDTQPNGNTLNQSRSSQYLSMVPVSVQEGIADSCYRTGGQGNKNRLKFSKGSDRIKTQTDRSYSSIGNQNIDTSNIRYRNANSIEKPQENEIMGHSIVEEEQESILSEEMKLRTIKHFMKANSHRSSNECEQYSQSYILPHIPVKKGTGIRNALKIVSLH